MHSVAHFKQKTNELPSTPLHISSSAYMPELKPTNDFFPLVNACLNGLTLLLLLLGYALIKQKKINAHRRVMGLAFATSACFLASYLYYHFNYSSQKYAGPDAWRIPYFAMLISHVLLATLNLPFILRLLYLGYRNDVLRHRRLARWVWPVWVYVSLTGVLIYLVLY